MERPLHDDQWLCRVLSYVETQGGARLSMKTEAELKSLGLIQRTNGVVLLTRAGLALLKKDQPRPAEIE